jgi:ribosomal protein L29
MKIREEVARLRGLSLTELKSEISTISEQVVKLKCKSAVDPVKQVHLFTSLRRAKARVNTEISIRRHRRISV